jgi:ABC-type nitrate/sulfonate/bicarbonate transport system permease component
MRVRAGLVRVVILIALAGAWELTSKLGLVSNLFISNPISVAAAIGDTLSDQSTVSAIVQTLEESAYAFVIAAGVGLILGVLIGTVTALREAYFPIVLYLLGLPKSILLPILILLFGIGSGSAVALAVALGIPFMIVSVIGGIELVEARHIQAARAFGANRWQVAKSVLYPAALPGIVTGLWHVARNVLGGVLLGQIFASSGGVGQLIEEYESNFQANKLIALVIVLSVVAIILGNLFDLAEKRLGRWRGTDPVVP